MNIRIVAIATVIALAGLALPGAAAELVPALGEVSPVGEAQAARCIVGYHHDCVVQIVCVRECGPEY